jgi:multidrug transporter EmrE-like cation transporter
MEIVFLSIIYWIAVAIIFIVGLARIIFTKPTANNKVPGLKLIIAAVIMVVIGGGACALMLGSLGNMR